MFETAIRLLLDEEQSLDRALPDVDNPHTVEMRSSMCRVIVELRLARSYLQGKIDSQRKLNHILSELAEIRKALNPMANLPAAVETLVSEVADVRSKDAAILTFIKGVPALVVDAVQKAIDSANGDSVAAVVAIQQAVADLKIDPDAMLAAINANTNPPQEPAPAPPPAADAPAAPPDPEAPATA